MSCNNQPQLQLPFMTVVYRAEGHGQEKDVSELPKVIGATKDGMISSFTTMAVVATLLASTEGVFLSVIKTSQGASPNKSLQGTVMVALTYFAILLNIGASWSALRMIDALGKMTFQVAKHKSDQYENNEKVNLFKLNDVENVVEGMRVHGLSGIWSFFAWHCYICLCFGSLCVIIQILVYIWMNEGMHVFIATTLLACIASIPIILSLFI